ncbi:MAG: ATP-binding protein [Polyangiaceae bacterium]|nr:ATP-binding protein [Polyangiaceae bacterium]
MKIQRASFIGVSGLPDLTLDLTDSRTGSPHSLVVIAGGSGSGKTRMIEALIAAKEGIRAYGQMTTGAAWIRSGNAAKIRVTFHLDDDEREFANAASKTLEAEVIFKPERIDAESDDGLRAVLGRYSHNVAHGKVDYFPSERRIPTFPPFPGLNSGEQRVGRLGKDQRKYGFVLPFLRSLDNEPARRERFATTLAALSPTCRYVPDTSGDAIPRCFSSRGGDPVHVGQISHGESDAVIFAATAATICLDHSLVFVDRPDLHVEELDPFIDALAALGIDNQLFLTGGSRLAAAARGAHIVSLKTS